MKIYIFASGSVQSASNLLMSQCKFIVSIVEVGQEEVKRVTDEGLDIRQLVCVLRCTDCVSLSKFMGL